MLTINEIYPAILGESRITGMPGVIVRLTGCHLRCDWCDTKYAMEDGTARSRADILETVRRFGLPTVLVTGGEPLLQREVVPLMADLLAEGLIVLLETSGTIGCLSLAEVPEGVIRCVDVKTPSSGIDEKDIDWEGIALLGAGDDLKFVCADRRDYEWSRNLVLGDGLPRSPLRLFSPVTGRIDRALLAEWILEDRLDVRFQLQLHKVLWPDRDRGI